MDKNEVFNCSVAAVIKQGRGSFEVVKNGFISCLYRDPTGNKCAAGHLLPDSEYNRVYEGKPCEQVPYFAEALGRDTEPMSVLKYLQKAHDDAADTCYQSGGSFLEYFKEQAREIAGTFGITPTPEVQDLLYGSQA